MVSVALEVHSRAKRAKMDCPKCDKPEPAHDVSDPASLVHGTKTDYYSNNPLFECLVCSRQVSSNRYATHLEKCMGIGSKSLRKGSARNAKTASTAVTQRLLNTNSRSASPASSTTSTQRKQGASPAPAASKDKAKKTESPGPLVKQIGNTSGAQAPKSEVAKRVDTLIPPKPSVSTPQTDSGSAPGQHDDDMLDEADFPSFSLSVRYMGILMDTVRYRRFWRCIRCRRGYSRASGFG